MSTEIKKWIILFEIIYFIFVGIFLKISTTRQRSIATEEDRFYSDLTDGQKNKYDFVKSFQFTATTEKLVLTTDRLQALCQTDSMVEVKFQAVNVAYAGLHPSISHIYSCRNIRKDLSLSSLQTTISDFKALHTTSLLKLADSELRAVKVYSDEDFPSEWILSDVIVTGELNFSVSTVEMDKVHTDHRFEFNIATSVE